MTDIKQIDGVTETPDGPEIVHLPALISDEFGTPRSFARQQIAMGRVEVDEKEVTEKFDLKRSDIVGKTIDVFGPDKRYRMHYRG